MKGNACLSHQINEDLDLISYRAGSFFGENFLIQSQNFATIKSGKRDLECLFLSQESIYEILEHNNRAVQKLRAISLFKLGAMKLEQQKFDKIAGRAIARIMKAKEKAQEKLKKGIKKVIENKKKSKEMFKFAVEEGIQDYLYDIYKLEPGEKKEEKNLNKNEKEILPNNFNRKRRLKKKISTIGDQLKDHIQKIADGNNFAELEKYVVSLKSESNSYKIEKSEEIKSQNWSHKAWNEELSKEKYDAIIEGERLSPGLAKLKEPEPEQMLYGDNSLQQREINFSDEEIRPPSEVSVPNHPLETLVPRNYERRLEKEDPFSLLLYYAHSDEKRAEDENLINLIKKYESYADINLNVLEGELNKPGAEYRKKATINHDEVLFQNILLGFLKEKKLNSWNLIKKEEKNIDKQKKGVKMVRKNFKVRMGTIWIMIFLVAIVMSSLSMFMKKRSLKIRWIILIFLV